MGGGCQRAGRRSSAGAPGAARRCRAGVPSCGGPIQFGENGVFISFEESEEELADNVSSLGFDLRKLVRARKLSIDQVKVERSEIEGVGRVRPRRSVREAAERG